MGGKQEIAAVTALAAGMAASRAEAALDPELQKITGYKFGDSREPLTVVQDRARKTSGAERLALERQFAQILGMPNATYDCKDFICRQLWLMGTKESIPALEKLMEDHQYGDMVRYALERNPDPEAARALRAPLETAVKAGLAEAGLFHIGLINSLGARKDAESITLLDRIALGKNEEAAAAAMAAIGKIGGPRARAILTRARDNGVPAVRKAAEAAVKSLTPVPARATRAK